MRGKRAVRPYRWLAQYYDEIFTFARDWGEAALEGILGPILPRLESACDLACGTGRTAVALARRGIKTYAVDLSPAMCRLARQKARRAQVPVRVIRADMRNFRLPEPVDLVVCECDALNHVPRKADLGRVAKAVARALRGGGYFYFDVNNRLAFEKIWPMTWYIEEPGVVAILRGGSEPSQDRAWSDVEWFIQDGECWRRHSERVEEVCWSAAEIRQALRDAGFGTVRAWDSARFFGNDPMVRRGYRTLYLARKRVRRG